MPQPKRKSKMISLRLSSAEYDALRAIQARFGARSISEFARQAMKKVIAGGLPKSGLDTLNRKVETLDGQIAKLAKVFEKQTGLDPHKA